MLVVLRPQQQSTLVQVGDHLFRQLGVLDEAARVSGDALLIGAVRLDGVVQRAGPIGREDALGGCHAIVVLTKRRRKVDDARAVLGRHEGIGKDGKPPGLSGVKDRTRVGPVSVHQLQAREPLDYL